MREGWKNIVMLDACDLITCGVAARPKYVEEGIPFLSAKNVKQGRIIYEGYNCITEENHRELTKKNKPLVGDILYTRVGSYGEAAVIEKDIEFSVFVSLTLIKPKKELLNSYFLKYYLNSHEIKTLAKNSITSSGVGNLNVGTVRKFPVPIPPLSEQKAIVKILDEAFAKIDQAKANIEKNIENAKELFQSKLNEIFSQRGEGWEEKILGEVCDFYNGKAHEKDIDESGNYIVVNSKFISRDGKVKKFTNKQMFPLYKNDIAMVMSDVPNGKALAKCFIVSQDNRYSLNQRICAIRSDKFHTKYLFYNLNRNPYLLAFNNGENQTNLRKGDILKCPLYLPPYDEQVSIAKYLDSFKDLCYKKLDINEIRLQNLSELKKSLLQKAFAGELTNVDVLK